MLLAEDLSDEDKKSNHRPNCFITDESHPELVYSDMLEHLLIYVQNVSSQEGIWREHLVMLENLEAIVDMFYMPEIHTALVPNIYTFALEGNTTIRKQALKVLAKIITHQHHLPAREEVIEFVISKMFQSKNFSHRRSFISFCCHIVTMIPFQMFKDVFASHLFSLKDDRLPRCAATLLKP